MKLQRSFRKRSAQDKLEGVMEVKVGQVWKDNDIRFRATSTRLIEVKAVTKTHAECISTSPGKKPRKVKVRLDRFKPNATGYAIHKDV